MEALDWLFQQFPSYQLIGSKAFKPTLENSRNILAHLKHPESQLRFVHVAGSNGKGSVSSYLASILSEAGLRVGLFTSPHIVHFSERIRVNGQPISNQEIEAFVQDIRETKLSFSPSFFEITFGMALQHFAKENCDICIIETGLGGRLDATNVISPELSIITSISLEHTDMLGDTLEAIATEKAGIIKSETPVILGKGCSNVYAVFEEKAASLNAKVTKAPSSTRFDAYFRASYQRENFACVLEAIEQLPYPVSEEAIEQGILNVSQNAGYFGRLQLMQSNPRILFDVAHNPDGIKNTLEVVMEDLKGDLYIIYGSSRDKDVKNIAPFFPKNATLLATEFSNSRSMSIVDLKTAFHGTNLKSIAYYNNPPSALQAATALAKPEDTIVVMGSFFLISDFF
ncbi:MAG: bifunctional folylpolyglutamate synthase/dihydrofolate synthase [bacterium]|nr:bifunctional folylpolyglutamate synthase/dihydrofolate synthase [bacterium]